MSGTPTPHPEPRLEPLPERLTLTSRPFIDPEAAREQVAPAPARTQAENQVEAPRLIMPEDIPDTEESGMPAESKPDFEPTQRMDLWWRLIGVVLLAALPLFYSLKNAPNLSETEARTVAASQRAVDRLQEAPRDRRLAIETLAPLDDREKTDYLAPPGTTWAHLVAGTTLDPAHASTMDLRFRARLVSASMGLLTVVAVFWCGFSIGGLSTATLAGLIFAAMPVAGFYFRQARPEALQTAAAMMTMACALWAMRPLRPPPGIPRQMLGWMLAGLCLGAAMLTGGPMALPPTLIPLLVIVFVCPHRVGHTLGLLAAVLIAALSVMPWAIVVHQHDPSASAHWLAQLAPKLPLGGWPTFLGDAGWRITLLAATLCIWATWLPAALLQPFSTSSRGARQRMMIGWSWFVTICALLVAAPTPSSDLGTLLTALPPAAILLAQLLRRLADLASAGHYAKFWIGTRLIMVLLTLSLSVLLPAALLILRRHPDFAPHPALAEAMRGVSLFATLGIGSVLLLIASAGAWFASRHAPSTSVACWAVWCVAAMTLGATILAEPAHTAPEPGTAQAQ